MRDVSIFFLSGEGGLWAGIPNDRALEWTRVLLRHHPSVPGTIIWMVRPTLERGVPAGFSDWAQRARVAEELGFSPECYEALQLALDAADPGGSPLIPTTTS